MQSMQSKTWALSLLLLLGLLWGGPKLQAQAWTPPGYGSGSSTDSSWGAALGYQKYGEAYYLTITPTLELPLFGFKIGLQIPLDVLVYDPNNSTGQDIPSLRKGLFDNYDDLLRMIIYVKYGDHLYYDPDDAFNWSMYYGKIVNGWMGHKTLIYRYINNYEPEVFRAGLMADINNTWGGVEHFSSDLYRKEVIGWRGYIRPWGVATGVHNLFFASGEMPSLHQVALSRFDPAFRAQSGVFYQEKIPEQGRGGRIGQHFLPKLRDVAPTSQTSGKNNVKFREVVDPVTGETRVEAIAEDSRSPEEKLLEEQKNPASANKKGSIWEDSFWSRFAIGYSKVEDRDAPLNLENDGSGNLVIDPETLRPRALKYETVTFTGMDVEFRLSPFRWLDFTPYADKNKIEHLENSEGTHIGIDMLFKLGGFQITFRPEYREFTSNYIPTYFDAYHAIERTIYNPGGSGNSSTGGSTSQTTKLAYLKSLPTDGAITKGYFVQLIFDWTNNLVVETTYEDYDGLNNSVIFTGIYIPAVMDLYFNAYYTKKNFDDIKKSYDFDDRSLAKAEIGYSLFGAITLSIGFQRTWQFNSSTGAYEPVDETTYSIGYGSSL